MLVLSRRIGESIVLSFGGVDVRVMPVRIGGDQVRLGFDAPREVIIKREEIAGGAWMHGSQLPAAHCPLPTLLADAVA